MNNYYDQHLHSTFSADSDTAPEDQIRQAITLGLKGLCFTEHLDPDYPECPGEDLNFTIDFENYFPCIQALQKKYQDKLSIGIGMEFGIQSHLAQTLHNTVQTYPFDFVIVSSHILNNKDPYYPEYFYGNTEEFYYREFLEAEYKNLTMISPEDFDTVGHLDYIVRYGPNQNKYYSYAKYADIIDPILEHLIRHDKCLEVNTGGLKYGLGETNPSTDILKRYRELGGHLITLGSDAHTPEYIGYKFSETADLLRSLGFETYTVFHKRQGRQEAL